MMDFPKRTRRTRLAATENQLFALVRIVINSAPPDRIANPHPRLINEFAQSSETLDAIRRYIRGDETG